MVCKASAKCLISFSVALALAERFRRGKVRIFKQVSYVGVSPPWQLETSPPGERTWGALFHSPNHQQAQAHGVPKCPLALAADIHLSWAMFP